MTRINCIPPSELTDKHLIAEYRELPRVFSLARHPTEKESFPEQYTLGKGHVKFFYNKLGYCMVRFHKIVDEMIARGFKPKFLTTPKLDDTSLYGSWEPTDEAMIINRQRIKERLNGQ